MLFAVVYGGEPLNFTIDKYCWAQYMPSAVFDRES